MSLIYRCSKSIWRGIVPKSARDGLYKHQSPTSRFLLACKAYLERFGSHDEIYDTAYYIGHSGLMERSAEGIADSIIKRLGPKSIIDVGCGSGEVLKSLQERGIICLGLDNAQASLDICRSKGLEVARLDLEDDDSVAPRVADLVMSTEVAEHIPPKFADRYVTILRQMALKYILITAAPPGQGGTDHVNEQPKEYWIQKFERIGAHYSLALTATIKEDWQGSGVESNRTNNVLVFSLSEKR